MTCTSARMPNAVANANPATADIYRGRQALDKTTFDPGALEWGKVYYWRIDEVNEANPGSPWKGRVWTFTTADFLVVDDMESYTDEEGNRIYQTWIDGYPDRNGSTVGNLVAPFAEQTIVHGGRQSMPMDYDNTKRRSTARPSGVRSGPGLDGPRRRHAGALRSRRRHQRRRTTVRGRRGQRRQERRGGPSGRHGGDERPSGPSGRSR